MKPSTKFKQQKAKPSVTTKETFAQKVMQPPSKWDELAMLRRKGNELYQKDLVLRTQQADLKEERKQNREKVELIISQMTGVKMQELDVI
jgi:hypothetical protein